MTKLEKEILRLNAYKYPKCRQKRMRKVFGTTEGDIISFFGLIKLITFTIEFSKD